MLKKLFCKIGRHWLTNHTSKFYDFIGMKNVYEAKCRCGKTWIVDSLNPLGGFRFEKEKDKT